MTFLKNDPRPCATSKQVFLDRFEFVVANFGLPEIPKCLERGLSQRWVKNAFFEISSSDHLGCTNG